MLRRLLALFKNRSASPNFETDAGGLRRRNYQSYDQYLKHQAAKLDARQSDIQTYDLEYEKLIRERYAALAEFRGRRVLCLGARLGGEVRAFKSLGALAIGIDIEPGTRNPHVLYGDFHNLQFPDSCFDVLFTNAIDHVHDLEQFLRESSRVLCDEGTFYVEVCLARPGRYEVIDTTDPAPLENVLRSIFEICDVQDIANDTTRFRWNGVLYRLNKRPSGG